MSFLILASVATSEAPVLDGLFATAASFLATSGSVKRADVGSYLRAGRRSAEAEVMRLVSFTPAAGAADVGKGRVLEAVLRQTLAAAGIVGGELRVYVAEPRTP